MLRGVNVHKLSKKEATEVTPSKDPKQLSEIKSMTVVNPLSSTHKDSYSYLENYRAKQRQSMVAAQTVPAQSNKTKAQHPGESSELLKQTDFSSIEQEPINIRNQKEGEESPVSQAEIVKASKAAITTNRASSRRKKDDRKAPNRIHDNNFVGVNSYTRSGAMENYKSIEDENLRANINVSPPTKRLARQSKRNRVPHTLSNQIEEGNTGGKLLEHVEAEPISAQMDLFKIKLASKLKGFADKIREQQATIESLLAENA